MSGVPVITTFGDGSPAIGETNVVIVGTGFGTLPGLGSVIVLDDADPAAASNVDQVTTFDSWDDLSIQFDMPGSMNNAAGSRWGVVVNDVGNWSPSFPITLAAAAGGGGAARVAPIQFKRRVAFPFGGFA